MKKQLVVLAALGLAASAAYADGNAEAGKQIATKVCAACHSLNGISNKGQDPQPPILAGQYKDYIIQALHEYKLNQRKGSPMNAMVAPLSEEDIQDVAEYFSGLPGPLGSIPKGGH
ncbi:MAG TPA: cytochrome c [Gammaproteobacteria bacterium]|nr:cytochrome c [Gammaproteobacteria bacterium]